MITSFREQRYGDLLVSIYPTNQQLGEAAAQAAAVILQQALTTRGHASLALATGNSQLTFLAALAEVDIDWSHIQVLHIGEYVGLADTHPASFRRFLQEKIVARVNPAEFYGIAGDAPDVMAECHRYEALLRAHPADLCCMGIVENGHLAFNDPPFADFRDSAWVKAVTLDEVSRQQQANEGYFGSLDEVPTQAITLTTPALLAARRALIIAPEARKAATVRAALLGPITADCPASILRQTPHAHLYLDEDAAALLKP